MIKIDAIGKQCPIPLIMVKNAVAKNGNGQYLVKVDNEIAVQNLEKMAKRYNFDYEYKKISNTEFEVQLNVADSSIVSIDFVEDYEQSNVCGSAVSSNNTVVVIKSEFMGHGDEDLGSVLVRGCIYAFSQLENPPKTFIFYNSGVKLACKTSECVEDLNTLKDKGVNIFACGTCLNHYNLQEQLAVGEITNMYDIVEMLNSAAKIIIP